MAWIEQRRRADGGVTAPVFWRPGGCRDTPRERETFGSGSDAQNLARADGFKRMVEAAGQRTIVRPWTASKSSTRPPRRRGWVAPDDQRCRSARSRAQGHPRARDEDASGVRSRALPRGKLHRRRRDLLPLLFAGRELLIGGIVNMQASLETLAS